MSTRLSLLVIKTHRLEKVRDFYTDLGLSFIEERHGTGPLHYSTMLDGVIFEIYPLPADGVTDSSMRIGFTVEHIDDVLEALSNAGYSPPITGRHTQWGYHAIVRDPDGRAVELTQRDE